MGKDVDVGFQATEKEGGAMDVMVRPPNAATIVRN